MIGIDRFLLTAKLPPTDQEVVEQVAQTIAAYIRQAKPGDTFKLERVERTSEGILFWLTVPVKPRPFWEWRRWKRWAR